MRSSLRATDRGTKPQPAERRAGYPRQPQTRSKGRGGNTEPQHGTVKNTGGSEGQPKPTDTSRTIWQHTLKDRARRDAADRGVRANHELTSVPDPNGDTKPSYRSRTNNPQPRRGDPIAKVGNPRGEEKRCHQPLGAMTNRQRT